MQEQNLDMSEAVSFDPLTELLCGWVLGLTGRRVSFRRGGYRQLPCLRSQLLRHLKTLPSKTTGTLGPQCWQTVQQLP
jgi:hypothetical protein